MSSNKGPSSPPIASRGSVDFILRTAMERQSGNKRPIRPRLVDDSLLGDDSEDSDFNADEHQPASGSDLSDDSNSSDGSGSNSDSGSEDGDEESSKTSALRETLKKFADQSEDFNQGKSKKKKKKKPAAKKNATDKKAVKKNGKTPKTASKTVASSKRERKKSDPYAGCIMGRVHKASMAMRDIRSDIDLKKKICSFCLGERSDVNNEIVECDSCKITVHEGCYGVSDTLSLSSGTSSSSTEPWFCDFCKNPDTRCICALCPNAGGLLKASADEQFVHLVCAHYTPGVISTVDGKPIPSKIPHSKWGKKACTLCPSARFANTGVTVECDAGMCKSHVHISCAQKHGLLSDPLAHDDEEADPYFASCKLHGQKEQAKHRATLYKVVQEQVRIKREKSSANLSQAARQNQNRILQKLKKIRERAAAKRYTSLSNATGQMSNGPRQPFHRLSQPNTKRKPRNIKSCAYSVSSFLQKVENMGQDITSLELEEKNERIVANIKKRWNVLPSLTVEYAAYYFDREARIDSLSEQCKELVEENESLNDKQIALSTLLENEAVDHMEIMDSTFTMNSELTSLKGILESFSPGNKTFNNIKGLPPRPKSPVRKTPVPQSKAEEKSKKVVVPIATANGAPELAKKTLKRLPGTIDRLTLHLCATCKKSDQQHLITRCDHCNKNYHLGCLDPPLTRMPRRSRLCGWMCSDCCDEESEKEEAAAASIDTEAPRALRGRTQLKRPEKYREFEGSDDEAEIVSNKPSPKLSKSAVPLQKSQKAYLPAQPKSLTPLKISISSPTGASDTLTQNHFQNSPEKNGPRVLKRKAENLLTLAEPGTGASQTPNSIAPQIKKEKQSPGKKEKKTKSPAAAKKQPKKSLASQKSPPVTSNSASKNHVHILPKPMKAEKQTAQKTTPTKGKMSNSVKGKNKSPPQPPVITIIETNDSDSQTASSQLAKNVKIVLSPVNGHGDLRNSHVTPPSQGSSPVPPVAQGKKGNTLSSPKDKVTPPKSGQRKTNSRTIKTPDRDRSYYNSLNMSGQIAAALNYNNASPGSGAPGTCDKCKKTEDKKNLVTCDECNLDFHFTCVPPYVPYNPKRRGYTWVCESCANTSDDDLPSIGEAQESVGEVRQ